MYLYVYGILLNAGGFSLVSGLLSALYAPGHSLAANAAPASAQSAASAFFAGYTWLTWAIILSQVWQLAVLLTIPRLSSSL